MLWIDEYISEVLAEVFGLTEAPKILAKHWEFAIMTERDFILGAADMYVHAQAGRREIAVFIEAKPKIQSLGALIRQIRFYQAGSSFSCHTATGDYLRPQWLVIAPDDRFAAILREQGILFHKPPSTL
jgi:hypothetical protein